MQPKFKIGSKVIISGEIDMGMVLSFASYGICFPRRNKIYTVRGFKVNSCGGYGLYLEEICNPVMKCRDGYTEPTFAEDNFISAETLESSKQWAENQIRDLIMDAEFESNEFSRPHSPLNYKMSLIKSIMTRLELLHELSDTKRLEFVNTFLDSEINALQVMDESLEKELKFKLKK